MVDGGGEGVASPEIRGADGVDKAVQENELELKQGNSFPQAGMYANV